MPENYAPYDWQRIKDLLPEAGPLDANARNALFNRAGLSDTLRAEIESLLALEGPAKGFLSVTASGMLHDLFSDDDADPLSGRTVGRYRITGELGTGGMGAVYLAERDAGDFDQQVAIKMLRRELNTASVRRNFEREKSILARLSHPNIARLLDAGTTDDGIPYLAMEYVDGVPIDSYCRERALGLNDRLKIFNKVVAAVAFAHRNLIVHRDLKPSNILITADGEPKLLDFGISKILDADVDTGQVTTPALTPAYASPEQIRGEPLTTATDIYSLGLVLYKILTGGGPFGPGTNTNGSLLRAITEEQPTLPSVALGRGSRESAIRPVQLEGDVDNILAKALSAEPERRYATADEFAADVWRFIDGLPVSARRATLAYRSSRFYRRNRSAVLVGMLLLISILVGAGIAVWQARAARAQAAVADLERDKAKVDQERSEKVSKFMAKVLSYANPAWYAEGARFGGDARVMDAMLDLADKIDTEFEGHADIQAELHHQFAEVFLMAGKPWHQRDPVRAKQMDERHATHALRALELRKAFYGDYHELVAKDFFYSGGLIGKTDDEHARLLYDAIDMMRNTNRLNLNLPYMFEAYSAYLLFSKRPDTADVYLRVAALEAGETKYAAAERMLREGLPLFRHHYPENNIALLMNECSLALALLKQQKWQDFDEHYAICRKGLDLPPDPSGGIAGRIRLIENDPLFVTRPRAQ